jgi:hypothetical protein
MLGSPHVQLVLPSCCGSSGESWELRKAHTHASRTHSCHERARGQNDVGETPLHLAADGGRTAIAQLLVAAGADVNAAQVCRCGVAGSRAV